MNPSSPDFDNIFVYHKSKQYSNYTPFKRINQDLWYNRTVLGPEWFGTWIGTRVSGVRFPAGPGLDNTSRFVILKIGANSGFKIESFRDSERSAQKAGFLFLVLLNLLHSIIILSIKLKSKYT